MEAGKVPTRSLSDRYRDNDPSIFQARPVPSGNRHRPLWHSGQWRNVALDTALGTPAFPGVAPRYLAPPQKIRQLLFVPVGCTPEFPGRTFFPMVATLSPYTPFDVPP